VATLATVVALHRFYFRILAVRGIFVITVVFVFPRIFLLSLLSVPILIGLQASRHGRGNFRRVEGIQLDFLINKDLSQG
jgi:hypothetical protein